MKNILVSPQVVAAVITSTVALILALLPTLTNNTATAIPTESPAPITAISDVVAETATAIPTETSIPITAVVEVVPDEPTGIVPTGTDEPIPTNTATSVPTSTFTLTPVPTQTSLPATDPPPANVLLAYDDVSFTIHNQGSQTLSINDLQFRSTQATWDAIQWGASLVREFPANNCLRIRDMNSGQRQPPSFCGTLLGLQLKPNSLLFWINVDEFEIWQGEALLATCLTANDTCPIFVP